MSSKLVYLQQEQEVSKEPCTVLVGVQLEAKGRELLSWAVGKVAEQGDRVVAVLVCRDSDLKITSILSLVRMLDDYLATYEGISSLKQVTLTGRVSQGNSIRKAIVKEAKDCDAMKVVVGVNKQCSLWGSASLAKYCAKKLPPTTVVTAIRNGKVIFQRGTVGPSVSLVTERRKNALGNILHPSVRMDLKAIGPITKENPKNDAWMKVEQQKKIVEGVTLHTSKKFSDSNQLLISYQEHKCPEQKLGWPLLQRSASEYLETKTEDETRKMSVVQWAMKLPTRLLPITTLHFELKQELKTILSRNNSNCKWFLYDQLCNSTNQFFSENLIGNGENSRVYKGCFLDGQQIAIKLTKLSVEASKDFLLEVDILTKLKHKNIIPLIGICVDDNSLISVYSYFQKGSLEENLHGETMKSPLPWDLRFKVAIGVAKALSYLHTGCSKLVIHRDVKSSNILLADEFAPKLSDFGLAIWAPTTSSYITQNDVLGTFGYLAPEYFMYGKVSDKIDVYAFGVVLLELLTGRKPINDERPKGEESLVMWATPMLERRDYRSLLDPNLSDNYDEIELKRLILAASLCLRRSACLRPQISKILSLLQGEEEIDTYKACYNDNTLNSLDCEDDEAYPASSIKSHLGVALLDVEDDDASVTSYEQSHVSSVEDYLHDQWSHSSFDKSVTPLH